MVHIKHMLTKRFNRVTIQIFNRYSSPYLFHSLKLYCLICSARKEKKKLPSPEVYRLKFFRNAFKKARNDKF
jgi:hypothetical protein